MFVDTQTMLRSLVVLGLALHMAAAGRSVPVESEYLAEKLFGKINPGIRWDTSNFLVDLSGTYSVCAPGHLRRRGQVSVYRQTPGGSTIMGLVDFTPGGATDASHQEKYIQTMLTRWSSESPFKTIISRANIFGCSVQPGCYGNSVFACLFDTRLPWNVVRNYRTVGWGFADQPTVLDTVSNGTEVEVGRTPRVQAFTAEQYHLVESIAHHRWDRSHLLENLSGMETSCAMINTAHWPFAHARQEARQRDMRIEGTFGSTRNKGDTTRAIIDVLIGWNFHHEKLHIKAVGCSVIPNCPVEKEIYMVMACVLSID